MKMNIDLASTACFKNVVLPKQLHCLIGFGLSLVFVSMASLATDEYSHAATHSYPDTVYFGDTHLHTALSIDSFGSGNRLYAESAYRFARGETVKSNSGGSVRLSRPLDFLVVADHAYNMGLLGRLDSSDPLLQQTAFGRELLSIYKQAKVNVETGSKRLDKLWPKMGFSSGELRSPSFRKSVWNDVISQADRFNNPGIFTAFIGYEWTSEWYRDKIKGNRHRVVIFKDGADKAGQVMPFSMGDSLDPEDLWRYLSAYEEKTQGQVLAIPHNANLSYGEMFAPNDVQGNPLTADYADTRSRWEPLYEVSQVKGDSETHPLLSPGDTFADYETWNSWPENVAQRGLDQGFEQWTQAEQQKKTNEYARSAWKSGLAHKNRLGVNPFKFGVIGSTDMHNSLSTRRDDDFWGKWPVAEPGVKRVVNDWLWSQSSAGLAAIWAKENTRESLFAAMKRKEVYATTGPRINVRFFGGWDYQQDDAFKPDLARIGYNNGVPMGGELTTAPDSKSPSFLIRAVKDPDGANLDRVQVIKGWMDVQGELHEKIYNVALSDRRRQNWRGKVKPVGSTVDIKDASYTNTIGDAELAVVWTDPDFNRNELAFYYLRVLEIPTPRWTAYDAKYFEVKDVPKEVPMVTQERAYSSPIWYSPIQEQGE